MPTLTAVGLYAPVPASVPPPVCSGVSAMLWAENLTTEYDYRHLRRRYALGGGTCALVIVIEIVFSKLTWRDPNRVRENLSDGTIRITGTVSR
jgi:hypothetical protein